MTPTKFGDPPPKTVGTTLGSDWCREMKQKKRRITEKTKRKHLLQSSWLQWPKSDPIGKDNVGGKIGLRGGFANFGAIEKRKRGG